jgi:hypothetical protein
MCELSDLRGARHGEGSAPSEPRRYHHDRSQDRARVEQATLPLCWLLFRYLKLLTKQDTLLLNTKETGRYGRRQGERDKGSKKV